VECPYIEKSYDRYVRLMKRDRYRLREIESCQSPGKGVSCLCKASSMMCCLPPRPGRPPRPQRSSSPSPFSFAQQALSAWYRPQPRHPITSITYKAQTPHPIPTTPAAIAIHPAVPAKAASTGLILVPAPLVVLDRLSAATAAEMTARLTEV
jgi:hypothetical protein